MSTFKICYYSIITGRWKGDNHYILKAKLKISLKAKIKFKFFGTTEINVQNLSGIC